MKVASMSSAIVAVLGIIIAATIAVGAPPGKGECASCTQDYECASYRCFKEKCTFNNDASVRKCFQRTLKEECEYCDYFYECKSGLCLENKCVNESVQKSRRCFLLPECAWCQHGSECAQQKCIHNRCTNGYPGSLNRCQVPRAQAYLAAPSTSPTPTSSPAEIPKRPNCAYCSYDHDCASYKCSGNLCGHPWQISSCSQNECSPCRRNSDCKNHFCFDDICSSGTFQSLRSCGRKDNCYECYDHSDCASNFCFRGKCRAGKGSLEC